MAAPSTSTLTKSGSSSSSSSSASPRLIPKKLPITSIPDMRFEQSFLASVRSFVHEYQPDSAEELKEERQSRRERLRGADGQEKHQAPGIISSKSPTGEPELWLGRLKIQWFPLLYLTIRDQVLSPIVQGALFGFGGLALNQLRTFLVAKRGAQRNR